MASRSVTLLALVALVFCTALLGSEAQIVKTNKATFGSYYKWARLGLENNPVNGEFAGAVVSPVVLDGKAVLSTSNAVVQVDLISPLNESAPFYYKSYGNLPIVTGVVRHGGRDDRLILVSGTPVRLAYLTWNATSQNDSLLYFQPITPPSNYPPQVGPLSEDVNALLQHPNASAEPFFYIVSGSFLARAKPADLSWDAVVLPNNATAVTATYDHVNNEIWVTTRFGQILRLNMSESVVQNDLGFVTSQVYSVGASVELTHIALDTKRGFVYTASAGTSLDDPGRVFKLDWQTGTLLKNITLERREYKIRAGFTDVERGVMYLAASSEVPRFVQIDLPDFYREYATTFGSSISDVRSVSWMWGDVATGKLWFGGQSLSLVETLIMQYQMADGCLGDCYGHGTCDNRVCTCTSFNSTVSNVTLNYLEPWCYSHECDFGCFGHGVCTEQSTCNCNDTWTGTYCEIPQCPRNCSGKGDCIYDDMGLPLNCSCGDGFTGRACEITTFLPCYRLTSCGDCVANPACGWCSDIGACLNGDDIGPDKFSPRAGCRRWSYGECNFITDIINYILTALVAIFILVCMVSLALEYTGEEGSRRDLWYRFQRSQKAWALLFQFQLVGSLTFLATRLPTIFVSFTKYWSWTLFGIGLPFATNPAVPEDGVSSPSPSLNGAVRSLFNIEQYTVYGVTREDLILVGVLFWVGVIAAIVMVLFFLSLILAVVRGRDVKYLLKQYSIYILLKVVDVAYYPLVLFSCVQMVLGDQFSGVAALGAIVFIVVGLGYPVFIILVTKFVGKNLFKAENKVRLFPVHGHVPPKALMLAVLPTVRKLLIACAIGFLSRVNNIAQLVLVMAIQLAFVVFVFIKSEIYSDYLQRYVEIFLAIVNILAYAVVIAFAAQLSGIGITAITLVYIVLIFLAVIVTAGFFVIVWLQGQEVYSCRQFVECLKGNRSSSDKVFEMK